MVSRQNLHTLLDAVPDHLLDMAETSLLRLGKLADDPFWRDLAEAETANEPLTPEDIAAIEAGWDSRSRGTGLSDEQLDSLLA